MTIIGEQLEADPVDPFDPATKGYVDATFTAHEEAVEEGETGPLLNVRMGVRAAFVYWSGFEANVSGHGYFQVQVGTTATFSSLLDDVATKSNWATFDGLTTGTTYYFRVRAVDAAGNVGGWATTSSDAPEQVATPDISDGAVSSTKIATNLQSDNYDGTGSGDGTAGWYIGRSSGNAEFNDVWVRGTLDTRDATNDTGIYLPEGSPQLQLFSQGAQKGILFFDDSVGDSLNYSIFLQSGSDISFAGDGNSLANATITLSGAQVWVNKPTLFNSSVEVSFNNLEVDNGNLQVTNGDITATDGYVNSYNLYTTTFADIGTNLYVGGELRVADGTASSPGINFDGDQNTGIYQPASDQFAVACGGNQRFLLGTGGVKLPGVAATSSSLAANVVIRGDGFLSESTSSARWKSDIQPWASGGQVLRLTPSTFVSDEDPGAGTQLGLIAEDVAHHLPIAALHDEQGPRAIDWNAVVAALIGEVAHLRADVEALHG